MHICWNLATNYCISYARIHFVQIGLKQIINMRAGQSSSLLTTVSMDEGFKAFNMFTPTAKSIYTVLLIWIYRCICDLWRFYSALSPISGWIEKWILLLVATNFSWPMFLLLFCFCSIFINGFSPKNTFLVYWRWYKTELAETQPLLINGCWY